MPASTRRAAAIRSAGTDTRPRQPGASGGTIRPWSNVSTSVHISSTSDGETAHGGTHYAWLDGYGRTHTDTLSQQVSIPSGCAAATLSFWLKIDTAETTTTTAFDKLTVKVGSTTVASFSNLNHAGYAQKTFNLDAFVGQTVTITFTGTEDSSLQTSFVVDDTALTVS